MFVTNNSVHPSVGHYLCHVYVLSKCRIVTVIEVLISKISPLKVKTSGGVLYMLVMMKKHIAGLILLAILVKNLNNVLPNTHTYVLNSHSLKSGIGIRKVY